MADEKCDYVIIDREEGGNCFFDCVYYGVCDSDDYNKCETYLAVKEWEKKERGLSEVVDG